MPSSETSGSRISLAWDQPEIALITMTGEAPNPSTFEAIGDLADRLVTAREAGARIVVLASDVPGHWFGHASLGDLAKLFGGKESGSDGGGFFRTADELAKGEMISIAAISGDCSGGGAEIGWCCDLRIAEEQVRIAQPEVLIGLTPGLGGVARLSRLIGRSAAAEMVPDGAPVSAARLHTLGAINRVVAKGRARETALAWARRLAQHPAAGLAATKRILSESEELPLEEALANEQRIFQSVAQAPETLARMEAMQAEYDAGRTPSELVRPPFEG